MQSVNRCSPSVSILFAFALTGCGKFSDHATAGVKNEYVWLTRYDVKTLDPAAVQDWTTSKVLSYLYPSIGELCDVTTKDYKTFHLELHQATFTNGEPVSIEDVRQTIERNLWTEVRSTVGQQFASEIVGSESYPDPKNEKNRMDGIELDYPSSLKITLKDPDQAFALKLKNRAFGITNHHEVGRDRPISDYKLGYGAGNWILDSVAPGREWKLKRKDTGEIIRFAFSGDSANRRNQFDTGSADYVMFAAHEIGVVKGHKNLTSGGPTTLVYLQMNPKTKPGLNKDLRHEMGAIIHADLDFTKLLGPHVKPTSNFLKLSDLEPLPSSGISTNRIYSKEHFEITFAEIGMQNPTVEAIVTALRRAGMDVQGRAMPSGAMLEANAKSELSILFTGWQPDFDGPLNTIPMLFYSKSSENHSGYKNVEVDRLIKAAQRGEDAAANIRKSWAEIERDTPCIPLYVQHDLVLMRREPPKP